MLTNCKEELENIRKEEVKGIFLRSKAKWIEEGEKPTKYFCHLEKRNYTNKTVTKLINNEGETINSQLEILTEIENFYFRLYSSRDEDLEDVYLDDIVSFVDMNKQKEKVPRGVRNPKVRRQDKFQERLVSTLEHIASPKVGTGPGVRRSKRPLLALPPPVAYVLWETLHNLGKKSNFGNKV